MFGINFGGKLGSDLVTSRLRFLFDRKLTVGNCLDKAARIHGEKPLYFYFDDLSWLGFDGGKISALELLEQSNRLANFLIEDAGLKRYDRVGVYKEHSLDYLILSLAIVRAGGIAVPLHSKMNGASAEYYLTDTQCRFVFTEAGWLGDVIDPSRCSGVEAWLTRGTLEQLDPSSARCLDVQARLQYKSTSFRPPEMYHDTPFLIVHTSGTTGFPKGVYCYQHSMIKSIKGQLVIQPVFLQAKYMTAGPLNHHTANMGFLTALVAGVPVYISHNDGPEEVMGLIQEHKIQQFFAFQDTFQKMYLHGLDKFDLSSIKMWLTAGDAFHEVHIRAFTERGAFMSIFGKKIISSLFLDTFGTSEIGFAALMRIATNKSDRYGRFIGKPTMMSPKVEIKDEHGKTLPKGVPGRLMVKGPTLFTGYWNHQEKQLGTIVDGWWWTGDIAYKAADGGVYHLDRHADCIESSTGTIYGLPIEEELLKLDGVAEAVVLSVPHPEVKNAALGLLQLRPGSRLNPDIVCEKINALFPSDQQLHRVLVHDPEQVIPRGVTGKVLKRTLREQYRDIFASTSIEKRSAAELEQRVVA